MKVSRTNPVHWLYLALFGLWVTCAIFARPFRSKAKPYKLVLYGHALSGNLLAIYRYVRHHKANDIDITYLCLNPHEYRRVLAEGGNTILASRPACARLLARADAVITDHGLHSMKPLLFLSGLKFFDVWHGIPFKGFDANDFRTQHRYDEAWVPSPLMAEIYVNKFGFEENRIQVTGYARTDRLIRRDAPSSTLMERLGLSLGSSRPVILFAPTWRQDDRDRNIYPFGTSEERFLDALQNLAESAGALVVVRTHLNTPSSKLRTGNGSGVIPLPFSDYPDTEDLLLATDVLVSDWSSISFDFLLLERPTVFLDVPAPFAKGFSLGPEYRFGEIVDSLEAMNAAVEQYLTKPDDLNHGKLSQVRRIRHEVYGGFDDGEAAARCVGRLIAMVGHDSQR